MYPLLPQLQRRKREKKITQNVMVLRGVNCVCSGLQSVCSQVSSHLRHLVPGTDVA